MVETSPAQSTGTMVATGHPLATAAALEVLGAGGNAVDAALAAAAVTWVVLPMMCGPGADAFALVWDPRDREVVSIGSGGTAPAAANREWFAERGHRLVPVSGPLAVGVPGALGVMEELASRFGRLAFGDLFRSAIRHAERGVAITSHTAAHLPAHLPRLAADPESNRIFSALREGTVMVQPELARTIQTIAVEGAATLYGGRLGEAITAHLAATGGLLTLADLAANRVDISVPPAIDYRGHRVHQTAPPSQGFMVLEELKILEGYDLGALPVGGDSLIHLQVEAKKLAAADRLRLAGDPRFLDWPLDKMISAEHAAAQRARIDPERVSSGTPVPTAGGDTTYLCVMDRDGLTVSFVHSLSHAFGAAVTVPGTGILLNNRVGRGFTLEAGHPNQLAPGKRTMSTLNCYLVTSEGEPALVGGTPGGDGQVQWNLQVLNSILDHGLDPQAAVSAPRWTHNPTTDPWRLAEAEVLTVEDSAPAGTVEGLRRRGHKVRSIPAGSAGGSAQVITRNRQSGILLGGSDPRDGGLALGR